MLGMAVVVALLALGFAAGYAVRGVISRKRRAVYLKLAQYTEPPRSRPPKQANARTPS